MFSQVKIEVCHETCVHWEEGFSTVLPEAFTAPTWRFWLCYALNVRADTKIPNSKREKEARMCWTLSRYHSEGFRLTDF